MSSMALSIDRSPVTIEGEYSVELSRESLMRFLIDFCLRFEIDIIDDPVVVRTPEPAGDGESICFGYRVLVPLNGSAVFAYFRESSRTFIVEVLAGENLDRREAAEYCKLFFNPNVHIRTPH